MHMIVNLDNLIRSNYDEIKAGTYRWKDEEVEAVYKLAGSALKKIVLNELVDEYEDVLQDLVCVFFTKVIPNYDINKKRTISTYSYVAFKNYYLNILRKPIIETVSLQEKISEDTELGELIAAEEAFNERIQAAKKEIVERFKELNENNESVLEYFFSEKKVTTRELSKKYKVTGSCIALRVKKAIEEAKKDPIIKKLI